MRLTAKYEIDLGWGFRVRRADEDKLRYQIRFNSFDVEVGLVRNGGASFKCGDDEHETRLIQKIELRLSRDEDSDPPPIPRNERGGRDLGARSSWFSERKDAYKQAAVCIANRVLRYFKFKMNTSGLREFNGHEDYSSNPAWSDENDEILPSGILESVCTIISPRGRELLGERDFTAADDGEFQESIESDFEIELPEGFLSDARASIQAGQLARGVLEMAIACEVAVKQRFSKLATPAGSVYRYLFRKGPSIRVIDLLDEPASDAFGASFKQREPLPHKHLDFLFRTRNSVAHRGELIYRDGGGQKQDVQRATLEEWWASVEKLMDWLGACPSNTILVTRTAF